MKILGNFSKLVRIYNLETLCEPDLLFCLSILNAASGPGVIWIWVQRNCPEGRWLVIMTSKHLMWGFCTRFHNEASSLEWLSQKQLRKNYFVTSALMHKLAVLMLMLHPHRRNCPFSSSCGDYFLLFYFTFHSCVEKNSISKGCIFCPFQTNMASIFKSTNRACSDFFPVEIDLLQCVSENKSC